MLLYEINSAAAAAVVVILAAAAAVVAAAPAVPAAAEEYDDKNNEPEAAVVTGIAEHIYFPFSALEFCSACRGVRTGAGNHESVSETVQP